MARNEILLRFLASQAFEKPEPRPDPGQRPFVTISREAGAGGHSLAEVMPAVFARRGEPALAGWQWADRDVCQSLSKDPRLGASLESLLDERFRGRLEDFLAQAVSGSAPQLRIYRALFNTIRSLAAVGRVVILGRAGVCVTRGYPGGVHVRLVGSRPVRVERVMRRLGWERARAERWVETQGKERAGLVSEYFNRRVDDPLLYDAVFNTDRLSFEEAAEAVADLVLARARAAVHA